MITSANYFYSKYYYGRRATLSIGNVLPLCGILEGSIICNIEHHIGDYGALPRASRDYAIIISRNLDNDVWAGAPPTEGRPRQTTARPTMLGTLQCPSSFGSGDPFSAKVARTISSTLDDL